MGRRRLRRHQLERGVAKDVHAEKCRQRLARADGACPRHDIEERAIDDLFAQGVKFCLAV